MGVLATEPGNTVLHSHPVVHVCLSVNLDLIPLVPSSVRPHRLPVPSRDEILSAGPSDAHYAAFDEAKTKITASPVDEDPAAGFERELERR